MGLPAAERAAAGLVAPRAAVDVLGTVVAAGRVGRMLPVARSVLVGRLALCLAGVERPLAPTAGPLASWLDEGDPPVPPVEGSAWATPVVTASDA
ncbi:hypothetical protein ORI20_30140 [Mycobacterium sp. CVI_P3]|uniref:Uncharacterized protein n=1 Tax=Mycobacterium pinniadriaticum TaxID=2994102 RepID=A0ABT3SN57_9MYCO|nr:hypothetical protein [Mycobacterium pinniadriaticum]MCX2934532.1 hypothetical protein [Mycobacterium pinniadriaticum]MCX2940955.1 hypothetical protein [Mycobacterium pinniadriaticum]